MDGLPVVDRLPRHVNAFIATDYSMLGMTLAQPTGEALAQLLTNGARPAVLERADRFSRSLR